MALINSEEYAQSLAHVVKINSGQETILGQAWLCQNNTMATCGHVVIADINNLANLFVKFPASGKVYSILGIRLHPSFVKQPDNLIKFDLALLKVKLSGKEALAKPLPFAFENSPKNGEKIFTSRFPIHLNKLSAAPQPLIQEGHFLGALRKHDNFHLLHDLALSPGDSGAAIFKDGLVIGLHCGDTATLPGLNLPTTSIRLTLWIDALRDLGVRETTPLLSSNRTRTAMVSLMAFGLTACIAFIAAFFSLMKPAEEQWSIQQPELLPVTLTFNKAPNKYHVKDLAVMEFTPRSDCKFNLFFVDANNRVGVLFPRYGTLGSVKAGQTYTVDRWGQNLLVVDAEKNKLKAIALISDDPLVDRTEWEKIPGQEEPLGLNIDAKEIDKRIARLVDENPAKVLHLEMDTPTGH